jgi:2-polyprenyl-6-methoxyphenol hydroxylase-like FAD-dependent oxidoreductase
LTSAPSDTAASITARCCIAGGGPAGMMLGLLLARAGIDVVVLEKHEDFLRDFRGDTVHPSTLEVMHELGLLDRFLTRPHEKIETIGVQIGARTFQVADFRHLPTACRFVALMPQWDFLNFLVQEGARYPGFRLLMRTEATGLLRRDGRVAGVAASGPDGPLEIHAELTVAADGRGSTLREAAGLHVANLGAPMDVLWLRLSRLASDPSGTLGRIDAGRMFVTLNRGDYWQCAYVIPKGGDATVRAAGLDAFRDEISRLAPHFRDRVHEIADWDAVKLLTVAVNRLSEWHLDGLLCIGDSAHAMSPIGGVGINLAIQDAVAAANILAPRFQRGFVTRGDLRKVQRRREFPTRMTQRMQLLIQNRLISGILASTVAPAPPWAVRMLDRCPLMRRLPARVLGMGFRPEHIRH